MNELNTTRARMRTKDKAIAQLMIDDPETSLTRFALDGLVASGKLPYVKIGRKTLINYDALVELLASGTDSADEPQEAHTGGIRPIKV